MTITLKDCTEDDTDHNSGTRWTHETSGAYVRLIHDDDPSHPLEDAEGIEISFREGDRYNGTMVDHPSDPTIDCPTCNGEGVLEDRWQVTVYRDSAALKLVAKGSYDSMMAIRDDYEANGTVTYTVPSACPRCKGECEIEVDLLTWFKHEHGAVAIHEFSTGSYNEASAVIVVTDNDWTEPAEAAKAWADEYSSWAEGDVWGIEYGGPGVQTESVWGFIGRENAENAAETEFLCYAIEAAQKEHAEAAECAARDIVTI